MTGPALDGAPVDGAPVGDAAAGDPPAPARLDTRVTALLGVRFPIVQGGLARVAFAELAAAVSNAGGLGQIGTVGLDTPEALRAEIRRARALTDRPFGVNLPLGRFDPLPLLAVALEESVALLSFTGGNPAECLRRCQGHPVQTLVLVSGPELARKAEGAGASMVATVGYEGGGHLGRSEETTLVMVPRVARAVQIPVLASGGIADGAGLLAALSLGAEGVEMGTRFVATDEARAHPRYKAAVVAAAPADTLVIKRSLGTPGRALRTPGAELVLRAERDGVDPATLLHMVRGEVNAWAVREGDLNLGFAWAGQCAGLIGAVEPAGDVVARMAADAAAGARRLARLLPSG